MSGWTKIATPATKAIWLPGVIVVKTGTVSKMETSSAKGTLANLTTTAGAQWWINTNGANADFFVASLYQSNNGTADAIGVSTSGADWCGGMWSMKVDTKKTVAALTGFDKATKCTWQFIASANTKAPAFKITKSQIFTYMVQIVEWADDAKIGSNSKMAFAGTP
jgi:hypothetical protein